MESAKPDTLEACHQLISMMDREVTGAMDDRAKSLAIIANVRALLTDGPGADTDGVPYIIQRADAEWRNAIRKALGE